MSSLATDVEPKRSQQETTIESFDNIQQYCDGASVNTTNANDMIFASFDKGLDK